MESLQKLDTPFGVLQCSDKSLQTVPFQSVSIEKKYSAAVYDEIYEKWTDIEPEYQADIIIQADNLKIGENYTVRINGKYSFGFGASDENAISNVITLNGCTLSLGAFDPNDDEKDRQLVPVYDNGIRTGFKAPEQYDVSKFHGYLLTVLPDWSGFVFKLLDRTVSEIRFRIAWIKHDENIVADEVHYENAVFVITTF